MDERGHAKNFSKMRNIFAKFGFPEFRKYERFVRSHELVARFFPVLVQYIDIPHEWNVEIPGHGKESMQVLVCSTNFASYSLD